MVEESDRHWACIAARRYNFGARRDEVAHLRLVTLQQVQVRRRGVTDKQAEHISLAAVRWLARLVFGEQCKGHAMAQCVPTLHLLPAPACAGLLRQVPAAGVPQPAQAGRAHPGAGPPA